MIDYTPSAAKPASIPLVDVTTQALGGVNGPANLGAKALGDYCAYLEGLVTAHAASLASLGVLPFAALDYPTIATSTNKATVTPAAATNGGTVAVASGIRISIAAEVTAGATGRMGSYPTVAFTSADLDVSSTYYLRAKVTAGALACYVQKGADNDAIPAGLMGTPNGASGGGFDSTVLDILLAKVVTGTSGTVPTVTTLANAAVLLADGEPFATETRTSSAAGGLGAQMASETLNWARTPRQVMVGSGFSKSGGWGAPIEHPMAMTAGSVTDGTGTLTAVLSRYSFAPIATVDVNQVSVSFTFGHQFRWSLLA